MQAKTALTTEDTEDQESGTEREQFRQLWRLIEQHVRRGFAQGMRSEAIGYAAGPGSGIAAGEDINAGIAYDQGLLRLGLHLSQDGLRTLGIRLLGGKAVATVHPGKKLPQSQRLDNGA